MKSDSALIVRDLSIATHHGTRLLTDFSCRVALGQCLFVVGESGAGKSLLANVVLGNLASGLTTKGDITVCGYASQADDPQKRQQLWANTLGYLPQEPLLALDHLRATGNQLRDVHRWVNKQSASDATAQTLAQFNEVGLSNALQKRPWQLSGGMAQRAALLIAKAAHPQLLILDEPTKGLDQQWQLAIIDQLIGLLHSNKSLLIITHDLMFVEQFEVHVRQAQLQRSNIAVLKNGMLLEQGFASDVLREPQAQFTQELIAAQTKNWGPLFKSDNHTADIIVQLTQVSHHFEQTRTSHPNLLFEPVNLQLHAGQRLSIVGPSGIGKSTLGNIILGLVKPAYGQATKKAMVPSTAPFKYQKLYQNPERSFPSSVSLEQVLRDLAKRHQLPWNKILDWVVALNLDPQVLQRHAFQVSGGELQRLSLIRVLCVEPIFLFADEPTSRLDVLTQLKTMRVISDAVERMGTTTLLVTHDTALAQKFSPTTLTLTRTT